MSDNAQFIKDTVNAFASAVGNGAAMTRAFCAGVQYARETGDTSILTRSAQRAVKRGDKRAAQILCNAVEVVFQGAKVKKKNDVVVGIQIKNAELNSEKLKTLHAFSLDGVSMRGKKFMDEFKLDKAPAAPFDPAKWAEKAHKANPDQLEAMIAALQARRAPVQLAIAAE